MSNTAKQTMIEDGTEIDGSVTSTCPITVSGELKGELLAPTLVITESGSVHGHVKVEDLRSSGEISGEIDAESIELSGKVSDSTVINATTLEVRLSQPGGGLQVTFGNCELNVGKTAGSGSKTNSSEEKSEKLESEMVGTGEPGL